MSYLKRLEAIGIALVLALGCSGGDTGGGGARSGGSVGGSGGDNGGAGDGASGGPASSGDFGNSGANPAVNNNQTDVLNPDAECKVGEKCDATSADEGCGSLTLEAEVEVTRQPGNLLVIFDQSQSMGDIWPGTGNPKWQAASNALVSAVTPLQDDLTLGAIFFPTLGCLGPPPAPYAVEPIDGPAQFPFEPAAQFLARWNAKFTNLALQLGTPLNEAFDQANQALTSATLDGNTAVIAFTDGEPVCFPDPTITNIPTDLEVNHAYNWYTNMNIPTYVVGLPGGAGVQILNDIAMYGGTNQYIIPDDPTVLEAELKKIVEETVTQSFDSCEITINPPAEAPDDLHLIVTENGTEYDVQRDSGAGGWTVTDAGDQVTLEGGLCDNATNGVYSALRFEFGCVQAPPLPPIPPPQ